MSQKENKQGELYINSVRTDDKPRSPLYAENTRLMSYEKILRGTYYRRTRPCAILNFDIKLHRLFYTNEELID